MNDGRLAGAMALMVLLPAMWMAVQDWRAGKVRLLFFSRMRSAVSVERASDPKRFGAYCAFNAVIYLVGIVFCVLLIFDQPR